MMRVGIDATLHDARTTGAGEYQRQLLRNLPSVAPDLKMVVYTARDAHHTPTTGLDIREMPWAPRERFRRIVQGSVAWRRRWRDDRLDLLHVPFYYLPPGAPPRSIVTIYDVRFLRYPETYPRTRAVFLRTAVPWSLRRATHIITISAFTKAELVELLAIDPERITVTLLAPRPEFGEVHDPDTRAAVRAKYGLPSRFILSTSTLEPRKNLARLVEAYADLRAQGFFHDLVLAGVRYFDTGELERSIARHGLSEVVHLLGYVDDADMPSLYSLADTFVYPSLYEGFGIPPLEAMACGTPVVASNTSSIPEVVGRGACLIDPLDVRSMAAGIGRVLKEPPYAASLRAAGHKRVRQFTWEQTARETADTYRRVLGISG
jgi:glycosyltransferase involved in cell wall biosynthesis